MAVAQELREAMTVDLVTSDLAPQSLEDYDLVVVGGPTHAFSMSRPSTRAGAVRNNGALGAPEHGIREWIGGLRPAVRSIPAIAFDTRVESPRLPGSAAKAARDELRKLGLDTRTKTESFRVHGYDGPLVDHEIERAQGWARTLLPHTGARA